MAIRINLEQTERELFCCNKWWGDPDMPADFEYPEMKLEGGEKYPLTFLCQIDCEDIAKLDSNSPLPKEGMLYFFAAIDEFIGYDSPIHLEKGELPKGSVLVKYAKEINFETFTSCMMVDDKGASLTEKALLLTLDRCGDDFAGMRMLGNSDKEGYVKLLQVAFDPDHTLSIEIKESDIQYGNWKLAKGILK